MSAQDQYTNELKDHFGYYATWNPDVPLSLGDIGILINNLFTKISNISELNLSIEELKDDSETDLEYNSNGNVSVSTKLEGSVAPQGSALTNLDAGIIIEFGKENSIFFKANKTLTSTLKDSIKLGEKVLELFSQGKWNKRWVIITELVTAKSGTIIISNNINGKIELKANADVHATKLDVADADFNFSTQFSRGLETKIISEQGLTPLFKLMGIKTKIFVPPTFVPRGIKAFDLLTPETASGKYKEQIYFGLISTDSNE